MMIMEAIVVFFLWVVVAGVAFVVLFFVIRGAVTEGMKRHTQWVAETQSASSAAAGAPPSA